MKDKTIGSDIGGVILDIDPSKVDLNDFAGENWENQFPLIDGAVDTLKKLYEQTNGKLYFVSTVENRWFRKKSKDLLNHWEFFEKTGIPQEKVHYCFKNPDKKGICSELGITHFIDDNPQVLGNLINTVPNLYHFKGKNPNFRNVENWQEFYNELNLQNS